MRSFATWVPLTTTLALAGNAWASAPSEVPACGLEHEGELQVPEAQSTYANAVATPILYINRCQGSSCSVTAGTDNAMDNRASVARADTTLSSYNFSDAQWNSVVSCVRDIYAPFGVEIVDQDPGAVPHFETMVGGTPVQLGYPAGVGGVGPQSCGVVNNAVSFVFPGVLNGETQAICETIAHESSHAWGLDHSFLCSDPMTYLPSCGSKFFQDVEAPCGEDNQRECRCGGQTQNSYETLLKRLGPANPTPPEVRISSPADGDTIGFGVQVAAAATDDVQLRSVELFANGKLIDSRTSESGPMIFNLPADIRGGQTVIEVRATDDQWVTTSETITVFIGSQCQSAAECFAGGECVDYQCVPGPGNPRGFGTVCNSGNDCESHVCLRDAATGESTCTEPCVTSCPTGFECLENAAYGSVCTPAADTGGGCRAGGGSSPAPFAFGFLAALLFARRRRSSRLSC